jgi:hypothetical protein
MLIGTLFFQKKYDLQHYTIAFTVIMGTSMISLADSQVIFFCQSLTKYLIFSLNL